MQLIPRSGKLISIVEQKNIYQGGLHGSILLFLASMDLSTQVTIASIHSYDQAVLIFIPLYVEIHPTLLVPSMCIEIMAYRPLKLHHRQINK